MDSSAATSDARLGAARPHQALVTPEGSGSHARLAEGGSIKPSAPLGVTVGSAASAFDLRDVATRSAVELRDARKLTIAFVLAKRFTLTPFALFVDVLRLAGDHGDGSRRIHFDWQILGENGLPVEASCGARMLPTASFEQKTRYDAVVIVGGLLENLLPIPRSMETFLRSAIEQGTPLIGLCTGSFILAEFGLLDNRRASVSWFHIHEFRERYPEVAASAETLYVLDEQVSTCSGGSGAADIAAEFVRQHQKDLPVDNAAKILLIDRLRDQDAPQPCFAPFPRARDLLVRKSLLFMKSNLAEVRSVKSVARHMGCTSRQLQRRFLADLGVPPSQAYLTLRLELATRLLKQTVMSIADVGLAAGFSNASHFSRAFRSQLRCTPSRYRVEG